MGLNVGVRGMQTITAFTPYGVEVSFNEIVINDIPHWFTDEEIERAKDRKQTYRRKLEELLQNQMEATR